MLDQASLARSEFALLRGGFPPLFCSRKAPFILARGHLGRLPWPRGGGTYYLERYQEDCLLRAFLSSSLSLGTLIKPLIMAY